MTILDSIHTQKVKLFLLITVMFFALGASTGSFSYDQYSSATNHYVDLDASDETPDDPMVSFRQATKALTKTLSHFVLLPSSADLASANLYIHPIRAPPYSILHI